LATKRKSTASTTKKNLEVKIAELEGKLSKLSSQLGQKPAGQAQTTPPPQSKPAQASKPAPQTQAAPPVTRETLIERVPMGVWHERKTKTPAYVPENPRAWARRHAEGADCPTQPWALQKAKITGYTAPSNKYFATRQRLAYHPQATSFTGYGISLGHGASKAQAKVAPPPPPAQDKAVPKESASSDHGSAKKQSLENYERDYLARLDQQDIESQELHQAAAELAAKRRASSGSTSSGSPSRGSLPKGF
jgi:hypothetical protein